MTTIHFTHSYPNTQGLSTRTSILLAGDDTWNGANYEQGGRNTFLYRTHDGKYFRLLRSRWSGDPRGFKTLTLAEAVMLYRRLPEHYLTHVQAFPKTAMMVS